MSYFVILIIRTQYRLAGIYIFFPLMALHLLAITICFILKVRHQEFNCQTLHSQLVAELGMKPRIAANQVCVLAMT